MSGPTQRWVKPEPGSITAASVCETLRAIGHERSADLIDTMRREVRNHANETGRLRAEIYRLAARIRELSPPPATQQWPQLEE